MKCPVCLDPVIIERRLNCKHSVCKECFDKLFLETTDDSFKCPLCKHDHLKFEKSTRGPLTLNENNFLRCKEKFIFADDAVYDPRVTYSVRKFQSGPRSTMSLKNYLKNKN